VVHRRDPDRNDLFVARRGQVADRGDQPPRLSGAAGRRAAARCHGDGGQPAGRPDVRRHQSADPARAMTTATTAATTSAAPLIAAPRHAPWREFWRYFSANRGAVAGLIFVIAVLLMAAFANVIAPHPPDLTNSAV